MLDAHTHLHEPAFLADRTEVIARAVSKGVDRFLCCGTSEADWRQVSVLTQEKSCIFPTFGLHPWFVAERSRDWKDKLIGFLDRFPSAVGEIGLDAAMRNPPEEARDVFMEQLELAAQFGVPASVHCVRAWEPVIEAVRLFAGRIPIMIHGFAGSVEILRQLQKAECFISFGCKMLDPKRKRERAAAKEVRLDRLLLETDSPYMPPGRDIQPAWMKVDDEGKARNEPAMIASILQTFAELRKTPPEVLAAAIEENGRQFLKACFPTE